MERTRRRYPLASLLAEVMKHSDERFRLGPNRASVRMRFISINVYLKRGKTTCHEIKWKD